MSSNESALVSRAEYQIAPTMERAKEIARVVEVCPLDSPEEESKAAKLLTVIKGMIKGIETERKALVAPYDGVVREVNAKYRAPRQELERVEALLKRRLGEAQAAREAAQRAALSETTAAVQEGDTEAAQAALARAREAAEGGQHEGISYRDDWEILVGDIRQVPDYYLVVDMAKVKADLRSGAMVQIPGLVITKTKIVIARSAGATPKGGSR